MSAAAENSTLIRLLKALMGIEKDPDSGPESFSDMPWDIQSLFFSRVSDFNELDEDAGLESESESVSDMPHRASSHEIGSEDPDSESDSRTDIPPGMQLLLLHSVSTDFHSLEEGAQNDLEWAKQRAALAKKRFELAKARFRRAGEEVQKTFGWSNDGNSSDEEDVSDRRSLDAGSSGKNEPPELNVDISMKKLRYAFLYKLSDAQAFTKSYLKASEEIKIEFLELVRKGGGVCSGSRLQKRLSEMLDAATKQSDSMRVNVIDFIELNCTIGKIKYDEDMVNQFFNAEFEQALRSFSKSKFFREDAEEASERGTLYTPNRGDNLHNRGINVAWILAITVQGIPLRIRSSLTKEAGQHSSESAYGVGDPTAFALEITIAKRMGYRLLVLSEEEVWLEHPEPPQTERALLQRIETLAFPIPSKQEQIETYRACLAEYEYERAFLRAARATSSSSAAATLPSPVAFSYGPRQEREEQKHPVQQRQTQIPAVDGKSKAKRKNQGL